VSQPITQYKANQALPNGSFERTFLIVARYSLRLLGHTLSAAIKARSNRTKIEQQRSSDPS
ncbi:hypothetical protein, partial [Pseudoalteromonas spongiae]|uniref:hypothetical protein n=1 Tax=Pseudoalteromonas spongiae TaxID=298657 RepID=UPI0012810C1B